MTESFLTMNRRGMFVGAAATVAATKAAAATGSIATRGTIGIYPRLPDLDIESRGDFLLGMNIFHGGDLAKAAREQGAAILKAKGIDPNDTVSFDDTVAMFGNDPVLSAWAKTRSTHQYHKYRMLQNHLHSRAEEYLAAMDDADKKGPGVVEFDMGLLKSAPEYTRREIHTQPGGYVGDPFAGYMYRYGTDWGVLNGRSYQDGAHKEMAGATPVPADGKVRRILDLGTSIGQYATSLKTRFPEAEVWGVDVGAPMVRYAHLKANAMGVDVRFRHALAEDTKFPSNHFDLVTANILFHETTQVGAKGIIKEVARVLRPGGVFYPVDFYTSRPAPRTAWEQFAAFWNHRWNIEDWMLEYAALDFNGELARNGLEVARNKGGGMYGPDGTGNVMGIKKA
jgi:SAM-dependent methyltransferase